MGIFLGRLVLKDKLDIVKTSKNIEFKGETEEANSWKALS